MEVKKLILLGGGGHAKSVIDSLEYDTTWDEIVILDEKKKKGEIINGIEVVGNDNQLSTLLEEGFNYAFVTLGIVGETRTRKNLYNKVKALGFMTPSIIDKTAIVSKNTIIGEGVFIGKGTVINSDVKIGNCCIINSGSIIEHDCNIGDFVHIAPGAVLSGSVIVGEHTHIGTNSTIINNIKIGSNSLIGVGSVVVKDVDSNIVAFGNPCKEIEK